MFSEEWVQAHSLILCEKDTDERITVIQKQKAGGGCMAKQQVEDAVEAIVQELLKDQDVIELVDVEYVKEHDWLRPRVPDIYCLMPWAITSFISSFKTTVLNERGRTELRSDTPKAAKSSSCVETFLRLV